ncbi:hypothetical protein BD309DRAFT_971829 [Dichomitus squalens]|nr:hypothetical protein BD309DRAFT_971829 [Dichomitus squalens]
MQAHELSRLTRLHITAAPPSGNRSRVEPFGRLLAYFRGADSFNSRGTATYGLRHEASALRMSRGNCGP